jgi:hypothetical protein
MASSLHAQTAPPLTRYSKQKKFIAIDVLPLPLLRNSRRHARARVFLGGRSIVTVGGSGSVSFPFACGSAVKGHNARACADEDDDAALN